MKRQVKRQIEGLEIIRQSVDVLSINMISLLNNNNNNNNNYYYYYYYLELVFIKTKQLGQTMLSDLAGVARKKKEKRMIRLLN